MKFAKPDTKHQQTSNFQNLRSGLANWLGSFAAPEIKARLLLEVDA
jgi:hypothetical protein